MGDRELLKRAAKAAGNDDYDVNIDPVFWNPLVDDRDAFRLAVQMRFAVDINAGHTSIGGIQERQEDMVIEYHEGEPTAATRRAIVRAAASMA